MLCGHIHSLRKAGEHSGKGPGSDIRPKVLNSFCVDCQKQKKFAVVVIQITVRRP